ncbi:hypothetical protein HGRIS_001428 [Hohenbuehelia grisea]|uniref:Uncharacterized protein n=1 Tax=Hohenbuehelia grisea TaxID=104357 RepID=A0ABR3JPG8_9AGAR
MCSVRYGFPICLCVGWTTPRSGSGDGGGRSGSKCSSMDAHCWHRELRWMGLHGTANAQRRGVVNYNKDDCSAFNGQRLVRIGTTSEYRFEVELWSKIVAGGHEQNSNFWTEYLPNETNVWKVIGLAIRPLAKTRPGSGPSTSSPTLFKSYITYTYSSNSTSNGSTMADFLYGANGTSA